MAVDAQGVHIESDDDSSVREAQVGHAFSEIELIELERARIGHEIHDTMLPLVFAASASLHGLIDGDRKFDADQQRRLNQIADWLDDAMQVGRRLLIEVYPPELDGHDWDRAVSDTLNRISDKQCDITWQVDPAFNNQPASVLSAAYRIVIEAVRNAIRHGEATEIVIGASFESGIWSVSVTDNGRGFDSTQVPSDRFGLRSMVGRAKLAGGSCVVDSTEGGPTTVTMQWAQ